MRLIKGTGLAFFMLSSLLGSLFSASTSQAASLSVFSQTPGQTPFIWNVTLRGINTSTLKSVQFSINPKTGSLTQPISATYSAAYLSSQNRVNSELGQVTIAVFGLYASMQTTLNNVTFTVLGKKQRATIQDTILTSAWVEKPYSSPTKIVPRNNVKLDYSFFYLKEFVGDGFSPVLIDTDGEVRWIGTLGCNRMSPSVTFYHNAFYANCGFPPYPVKATTLFQNNLDGSFGPIFDYAEGAINAITIGHHNYDVGKQGLLLEIDANSKLEQEIIEVSPTTGQVYNTFDFGKIISQAMIAGGDDPTKFVRDPNDWFHNNSATYWKSRDELVVSSRENFVIGIDYTTQKIKWILGDSTKIWYSFPSLRKFALILAPGTIYPEGQHALSITSSNQLLLFDNNLFGFPNDGALNPNPPISAPRIYSINEKKGFATETWQFLREQPLWSPICSSIYQDGSSFLVDYAAQGSSDFGAPVGNGIGVGPEIMGLDANKNVAFDYYYLGSVKHGWIADPIHLENLQFSASAPILSNLAAPFPSPQLSSKLSRSLGW
jgi:hypothetical protein